MPDPLIGSAELLGRDGPFAHRIPHFAPRAQQQAMAAAVAATLDAGGLLVAEAGTGTGKTFAYLAPVFQRAGKVVISTGTKALQDQLFQRDIPVVKQALASPLHVALLKGRANYLCLYRLDLAGQSREIALPRAAARMHEVRAWAGRTRSGEISEVADIPGNDPFWYLVTSNAENCLGQDCPAYADCHVIRARRAAQEADVVVINHHLLFSDILLRQEGFGELLPQAQAFILDEAHQLPELASRFFGTALSGRQLGELARDSQRALYALSADTPQLEAAARALEQCVEAFRLALGDGQRQAAWPAASLPPALDAAMHRLQDGVLALLEQLEAAAGRDKELENCWRRAQLLGARLRQFAGSTDAAEDDAEPGERITWFETGARSFTLHVTPMDFAATFRASVERYQSAWVFTSATLAVGEDFSHFCTRLGIGDARTARWDSPFDYAANAVAYLPRGLPEPGTPGYTAAVVQAACPVLAASGGRAFILFTSHHALQEAARLFARMEGFDYPVFVQGTLPHNELLERFRRAGNGVLLGTGSFWEGVDVRGPALSCVIIDKLPFAPPDDPVFQARASLMRARGGNPFRDYQLPAAVIALKQGVGRLIRDVDDRGVLMLCDPRLFSKSYGQVFLRNLPPMRRVRELAEIERFYAGPAGEIPPPDAFGVPG
ncbi:MAG: ATP-dependent DNA helicase [Gammaproteobacteria bacterium]|nr:ATP-dependent DNA helicase [Gammaproteobacteria bacterium]